MLYVTCTYVQRFGYILTQSGGYRPLTTFAWCKCLKPVYAYRQVTVFQKRCGSFNWREHATEHFAAFLVQVPLRCIESNATHIPNIRRGILNCLYCSTIFDDWVSNTPSGNLKKHSQHYRLMQNRNRTFVPFVMKLSYVLGEDVWALHERHKRKEYY